MDLIERHQLRDRIIVRQEGAGWEARFLFRDPRPLPPVWHGERLTVNPGAAGTAAASCPAPDG